ncbi:hypothetical protein [Streptomyces sp. NBC_01262]|uniref:hypothetical protein n=1 Tax=Streptomyces sp. NBC_01262 TaxID=2903803 RepID=UPI002E344D1B|nr:hypothetical protein [Streptomyces sp. NBC_01262]
MPGNPCTGRPYHRPYHRLCTRQRALGLPCWWCGNPIDYSSRDRTVRPVPASHGPHGPHHTTSPPEQLPMPAHLDTLQLPPYGETDTPRYALVLSGCDGSAADLQHTREHLERAAELVGASGALMFRFPVTVGEQLDEPRTAEPFASVLTVTGSIDATQAAAGFHDQLYGLRDQFGFTPPPRQPAIGDTVLYELTEHDAKAINTRRIISSLAPAATVQKETSDVRAGDIYAAIIVRAWQATPDTACNLQVLLDGPDVHWAQSVFPGEGPGHWHWPPRP